MLKQEIIGVQTCRNYVEMGKTMRFKFNDIKPFIKLFSFFKVNHYISVGPFDLPGFSGFIVMRLAQHNRYIVSLSVCGQPCNWIHRTPLSGVKWAG